MHKLCFIPLTARHFIQPLQIGLDKQDPTPWQGNIAIVGVNIHSYEYILTLIYLCISPKQLVQQMVGDYLSFFQLITHAVNFTFAQN